MFEKKVLKFYNLAVSGVLLMDNAYDNEIYISDCIPLFHQVIRARLVVVFYWNFLRFFGSSDFLSKIFVEI